MEFLFLLFPLLLISLEFQFSARRELNRVRVNIDSLRHDRALDRNVLDQVQTGLLALDGVLNSLSENLAALQKDRASDREILDIVLRDVEELARGFENVNVAALDQRIKTIYHDVREVLPPVHVRLVKFDAMAETIENLMVLDETREVINQISDGCAALSESLGKLQEDVDGLLPAVTGQTDELAMRINSMSKSLDTKAVYVHTALAEFTKPYAEIRENLDRLAKTLETLTANDGPANPDTELDAQLSKAMEEGVLNLMQYAAGKTSGGVEVGLG